MFDLDNIAAEETAVNDLEEVVMGLIINSGQARSLAYAALKQAKQGDFEAAKTMMEQSRMALSEAHLVQTQLIESDEGEGKMKVSLVLVHAQDHLMTSMLARELVAELKQIAWKPCAARLITSFSPPVIKSRSPFAGSCSSPVSSHTCP